MAIKKIKGHKSKVYVDHDDDTTFTLIEGAKKITFPKSESEEVDITCLESEVEETDPADPPDYGEFKFEYFWDPIEANHTMLDDLRDSKAKVNWQVEFPTATPQKRQFAGWCKSLSEVDLESKSPVMRTCVVRVTSKPTIV